MSTTHKSTGPRTAEGKARSSRNALKHGLTAAELVIQPGEESQFDALRSDLQDNLRPQGGLEEVLFNQIVHAAWTLRRTRLLEVQLQEESEDHDDPIMDGCMISRMERLGRYAARAERSMYRAIRELRLLQTSRCLLQNAPTETGETAPLADIKELTKRTPRYPSAEPPATLTPGQAPKIAPIPPRSDLPLAG